MKNSRGVGRAALLGAALVLGVVSEARAATLGKVLVQPSFETAGVYISLGDDSGNESVAVEVKGPGDADFHPAHAATRFEPHAHATSLFGLAPGADYSVRVTLNDPDGVSGSATTTTTLHTRAEPSLPAPVRVRWVGPSGHDQDSSGGSKDNPYLTPGYALAHAQPGDEIRVLAGTYGPINSEGLHATEAAPVVLRADDPGARPVIDGGASGNALYVNDASWLVIDGFEIRNGGGHDDGHGVYLRASSHVAVRHCFIHDNGHDNILISKGSQFSGGTNAGGFHLIEDSEIADTNKGTCDPNSGSNTACSEQTYYGIKQDNNPGGGTVIRRNHVHGHADNTSPCGDEASGRDLGTDQAVLALTGNGGSWTNHDLEIYDNTFEDAKDDGIELDGICVNARVFRNTIKSAQNGFSAAPVEPGPYFIVRNVVTGTIGEAVLKINTAGNSAVPSRNVFVYHNDFVRSTAGTLFNAWFAVEGDHNVPIANVVFRNNVFSTPLGGPCISSYNHGQEQPSFDGDLWYTTDTSKLFSWWNGSSNDSYDSFAAWQAGAKVEPHGAFGDPMLDGSFHPTAGSPAVDHAVPLAGINDAFSGSGPDVGAFELGASGSGAGGSSSGGGSGTATGGSPAGVGGSSGSSGQPGATGGTTSTGGQATGGTAGQGSSGASASAGASGSGAAGGASGSGDAPGDADDDGCGCRAAGRGPGGQPGALALVGLVGLVVGRRVGRRSRHVSA